MIETLPNTGLETRTAYARSVEDAPRLRAIHTLTQLGLLERVDSANLYHGRAAEATESEPWRVDPSFANGGNDSGNFNINARATLYASDRASAREFAAVRAKQETRRNPSKPAQHYRPELHRITSHDADARVINTLFDETRLSGPDKIKYDRALEALLPRLTEGSPLDFEARGAGKSFMGVVNRLNKFYLFTDDIPTIAKSAGISEKVALQLAGAYNVRQAAKQRPQAVASDFVKHPGGMSTYPITVQGKPKEMPMNLEYAQRLFSDAHIIGARKRVYSATIDQKLETVAFFDLGKTTTPNALKERKAYMARKVGALAVTIGQISTNEKRPMHAELLDVLSDPYATPQRLMQAAKKIPGYDAIFESKAGNKEGFTIGEHTETVLRNFDENYADRIPVQLLAPMRLAIIAHDTGKKRALDEGRRDKQNDYNAVQAWDFFDKVGVDTKMAHLLTSIIAEGEEHAYQMDIKHSPGAAAAMSVFAVAAARKFYGPNKYTNDHARGIVAMCKMLQVCDGGAYTSMAITRSDALGHYRNYPSFNDSFVQPVDLGNRSLRRRKPGQRRAADDLTPSLPKK